MRIPCSGLPIVFMRRRRDPGWKSHVEMLRQGVDVWFVHLSEVSEPLAVWVVHVPSRLPKRCVQPLKAGRIEAVRAIEIRTRVEHLAEIDDCVTGHGERQTSLVERSSFHTGDRE